MRKIQIATSATVFNNLSELSTEDKTIAKVDKPVGPCGACRQSLSEYEIKQKQHFPVIFMGEVGEIIKTESLDSLLPFSFDSSYL